MNYRTLLIRGFTFLGGIYFFLKFVLPKTFVVGGATVELGKYNDQASVALTAMGAMALGLGLLNLLIGHGSVILFARKGWIYSVALLAGLGLMLALSTYNWIVLLRTSQTSEQFFVLRDFAKVIRDEAESKKAGVLPYYERNRKLTDAISATLPQLRDLLKEQKKEVLPYERAELQDAVVALEKELPRLELAPSDPPHFEANISLAATLGEVGAKTRTLLNARYEFSLAKHMYSLFFDGIFVALGSAMFSLLGFYIASAAYRAFRIKSFESALMMGAALLVILGQIPFALFGSGEWGVYLQSVFPKVRLWLLTVPNSAAFRAISIGAEVAALVMAFRMWLSIESGSFAEKEKGKR